METQPYDDTSVTSDYDEEESPEMQHLNDHMEGFQITGMENLPRISSDGSEGSWDVESYAADSMGLAKARLGHLRLDHDGDDIMDGASSLGYGSDAPQQQRGRSEFVIPDEDDWTVQSDCNDSVGLAENRLGIQHEQHNKVSVQPLARVTRRRASMDNFVQQEQQQVQGPQPAPRTKSRRSSMSTVDTAQDSICSSHCSGTSEDRRGMLGRHKSLPYVKSSHTSNTVPLWPNGETPRQKMARRVSNGGTPCAA